MTGLKKSTRPVDSTAWGPRGMRNAGRGQQRYNPDDKNLRVGLGSEEGAAESSVNDHGGLTGLGDDDHSQYLTSYRQRGKAVSKVATYNATTGDYMILCDATGGAITVNLPAVSGANEVILVIKKIDSSGNAVTIDGSGSETIDGATTQSLSSQWSTMGILCTGSAWHRLWQI